MTKWNFVVDLEENSMRFGTPLSFAESVTSFSELGELSLPSKPLSLLMPPLSVAGSDHRAKRGSRLILRDRHPRRQEGKGAGRSSFPVARVDSGAWAPLPG